MLYKITGEQPFQVNSTSFSVSPSESGYNLYISADGINYSPFLTVPSGVTKQMVDMNNGNYYRLMGNTSEVTVNWERDCGRGGGGVAGVSSLDGQTGALTTKTINGNSILGSGDIVITGGTGSGSSVSYEQILSAGTEIGQITIDGSATTIYAPAGGSEIVQNYQIVSALTDVEGEEGVTTLSGFTMNFSAVTKNTWVGCMSTGWDIEYFCIADALEAIPDIQVDTPGFYLYCSTDMSSLVQIADDDTWHTWENPMGIGSYLYKRNGYDIDVLFTQYPEDVMLIVSDMDTWEDSDEVATGDTTSTVTAIVVKEGTVAYLTTDGKFYQYLSNNWSEIPQGGGSGPVSIFLDELTQAERANLYNELHNTTSADTVNENYAFYKTFNNGSTGPLKIELTESDYFGRIIFSGAWLNPNDDNRIMAAKVWIDGNGNFEVENLQTIQGAPARSTDTVGYFDTYTNPIIFDQTTSAFTNNDSTLTNGSRFGGSFYWFIVNPYDGNWGIGIPILGLKIIDANNEATMHYYPSTSTKSITTVTVDGVDYDKEFTANYGKYTFKMLLNSTPQGANFQMIQNY